MDRLRRRALGRQAEILGHALRRKRYRASDSRHRPDRRTREAEAMDEQTRPHGRGICCWDQSADRALRGATCRRNFTASTMCRSHSASRDIVAIARGIWWSLNGRIDRIVAAEAARLLPEAFRGMYLTPEASENRVLQTAAGTDDATGSNNWAVHGSRTTGGKPVLCGDPHQPFWVPSTWYEYALHGPEDDAAGAGHPGFPGMWWGSNGTSPGRSPTTWPRRATCMSSR